ncbi:hypothetical protein HG531_009930 [Fusarium graminearum]|nr:hypothetical protein HG531_009930 [Fusarium graminearum]
MCAISHVAGHLNIVIRKFAQLSIICTKLFLLGSYTQGQTRDEVENEEQKAAQLDPVAINPADGVVLSTVKSSDGFTVMNTSEDVASHTANSMDSKDIKTVVNVHDELELGGKVAYNTTANSDNNGSPRLDEASSGSNSDKTRDGTGAETNCAPLLFKAIINKVVAGKVEEPAVSVPGPVCDRVVDNGGPEEHEDDGWEDATSVCHGTNGKSSSKHALVKTEENIRKSRGAVGLGKCLHETELGEIAKEGISKDQSQGRLATSETTVEETHAGNHEKNEHGAGDQEDQVARLFTINVEVGDARRVAIVGMVAGAITQALDPSLIQVQINFDSWKEWDDGKPGTRVRKA